MTNIENEFDAAMLELFRKAKQEAGYNASRFFQMLTDHGGVETARILINADTVSDGYAALWERGRLDLTVEALIYDRPQFHRIFEESELKVVRERLVQYEYRPALSDD